MSEKLILESVTEYIKRDETDYALMITGKWGSGKTYFWKNYIKDELKKLTDKKIVYISLFGLECIEDISKKIFVDIYLSKTPNLCKRLSNKITEWRVPQKTSELIKVFFNIADSFGKKVGNRKIDFSHFIPLNEVVICFDDLERVRNTCLNDLLGYINNFVEHNKLKAVFLCDEDKINEYNIDEKKHYNKIKEKVIGKTINFVPDYKSILLNIIGVYKDDEVKSFLFGNVDYILKVFYFSEERNIRTLKQALDDFKMFFYKIKEMKTGELESDLIQRTLSFIIAYSIEFKKDKSFVSYFNKIPNHDRCMEMYYSTKLLEDKEQSEESIALTKFINNYFGDVNSFYFFKSIEYYIRTGLQVHSFSDDIEHLIKILSPDGGKGNYIKMIQRFQDLENDEFVIAKEKALKIINSGEVHFVNYFRLFMYYQYFCQNRLIEETEEELFKGFITGLHLSKKLSDPVEHLDFEFVGVEKTDNTYINTIITEIKSINEDLKKEKYLKDVEELFGLLPNNAEIFFSRLSDEYFSMPIFKYAQIDNIPQIMFKMKNKDISRLNDILGRRYSTYSEFLKAESDSINHLEKLLSTKIKKEPFGLKSVLLSKTTKILKEAMKYLKR